MPKSRHARIRPGWILTLLLAILIMASALVACSNTVPDDEPPNADGLFRSVSVGQWHTCGVRRDGSVDCWGANDSLSGRSIGQATPPSGSFVSVSAGSLHTCGVRINASVDCWGYDIAGQATPPAGPFVSVNAGGVHTCGVRSDGSIACWGGDDYGRTVVPEASFASVSSGEFPHVRG